MGELSKLPKIQEIDEPAAINRLSVPEGAIQGVKKSMLPDNENKERKVMGEYVKNVSVG